MLTSSRSIKRGLVALAAITGAGSLALISVGGAAADSCPNAALRVGPAASLPDCRAYELVSVPNAGGRVPLAKGGGANKDPFTSQEITPAGNQVGYNTAQGALPGYPGNGATDRYEATRTATGWNTVALGPDGSQVDSLEHGSNSPDLDSFFFHTQASSGISPTGSLASQFPGESDWIRMPDGSFEPLAKGSLGVGQMARGFLITAGATHIIFRTQETNGDNSYQPGQLEPDAAPTGQSTIYDRSFGGPTHVVSLLPGNAGPLAGANYVGASADANLIAFSPLYLDGNPPPAPLYVRDESANDTYQVTANPYTFAGIYGGQVFYANAASPSLSTTPQAPADLFSFDPATQSTTQITTVGDARFVNVSDDGSRVYFVSPSQINGQGTTGQQNLYVWERNGGTTTFVATLTNPADVTGDLYRGIFGTYFGAQNMAAWAEGFITPGTDLIARGAALNRSTPDGSVLVFEARSQLTAFDNAGHSEIYRYDAISNQLDCLSCVGPDPATADSRLQSPPAQDADFLHPLSLLNPVQSVSADGNTVVFESDAGLLPSDGNGETDVYLWEKGRGLSLVSTGQATQASYLYGMTPSGGDVFFETPQTLVPINQNGSTPALYDARVDGGIAAQFDTGPAPCVGDACQGASSGSPPPGSAATVTFSGPGNASPGSPPSKATVLTRTVRGSAFLIKVQVPGGGRITISASAVNTVRRSVSNAGAYGLRLTLTSAARRALGHGHTLKLRLRVTYGPTGGNASSVTVPITVKQALRRHARRATSPNRGGAR